MGNDSLARTARGAAKSVDDRLWDLEHRLLPARLSSRGAAIHDYNDVFDAGFYFAEAGVPNAPFSTHAFAVTVERSPSRVIQWASFSDVRTRWRRFHNGTVWSTWRRTDRMMIPTAVGNGTFDNLTGRITLTAGQTSFTADGWFTSEFRAYRIMYRAYSDTIWAPRFQLRAAGVSIGAGYTWAMTDTINGSTGASNDANIVPARNNTNGHHGEMVVVDPMTTAGTKKPKGYHGMDYGWTNLHTTYSGGLGGQDTVALDGLRLFTTGATVDAQSNGFWSCEGIA